MTTPDRTTFVNSRQKRLDAAKTRIALVRTAVEKTNQVLFDATDDYLNILIEDLTVLANGEPLTVSDIVARVRVRTSEIIGLEKKVAIDVTKTWAAAADRKSAEAVDMPKASAKPAPARPRRTAEVKANA